jgi:hypothetical protein
VNNSEEPQPHSVVNIKAIAEIVGGAYLNNILTGVNEHVVRVSGMTEPYFLAPSPRV